MNKNEYIKNATSKIFDYNEKEIVELELTDHLLKNQEFSEQIGYESDKAEIRAVEAMGDAEEIAEHLGELHNDYYNPIGDVIFLVLWLALLGGGAYFLNQFIFGDKGCIAVLFSACCLAIAVCFIAFSHMLGRNKIFVVTTSALAAIGSGAFSFFVMNEANDNLSGSFEKFKEYFFDYSMPLKSSESSLLFVALPVAVIGVFALVFCLTSVVYRIKTLKASNTLFDNHMRKHAKVISLILSFLFIALSVFFGVKFVSAQNFWREEYKQAYLYAVDVSENCKTFDEVKKYIEDSDYDFIYSKVGDKVNQISAVDNLYYLSFILGDNEIVELSDEKKEKYFGDYAGWFDTRYDYHISVTLPSAKDYPNQLESITFRWFISPDEVIDGYRKFICDEHTQDEKQEFIKTHIPTSANISPAVDGRFSSSYSLKFTTITGCSFQHDFDISIEGENVKAVRIRQNEIAEIIKANPNASFEKIAALTKTKLVTPEHTLQEYKDAASMLGTLFDDYKNSLDELYYTFYKFYSDKGFYFTISKAPYNYVIFESKSVLEYNNTVNFDKKESIKCNEASDEAIKKVFTDGYCYSKNGVPYKWINIQLMPYFTSDGSRYMYYSYEGKDEDGNYVKNPCLINKDGVRYDANICFINSNGNLYIDKTASLKSEDGYRYKDAGGNTYTKALETSWDKDGNIIYYDEYKEENTSILAGLF